MAAPLMRCARVVLDHLRQVQICSTCVKRFSVAHILRTSHESEIQTKTHFGFQSVRTEEKEQKGDFLFCPCGGVHFVLNILK